MNIQTKVTAESIHDLLDASVEKIAQQWIDQLNMLRANADALEAQLIACAVQTKANVAKLHELGEVVAAEAARGREICASLAMGIAEISGRLPEPVDVPASRPQTTPALTSSPRRD